MSKWLFQNWVKVYPLQEVSNVLDFNFSTFKFSFFFSLKPEHFCLLFSEIKIFIQTDLFYAFKGRKEDSYRLTNKVFKNK